MKKASDWLGVTASSFCALHCTIAPVLVGMSSFDWIQMPGWEYVFVVMSIIALFFSLKHIHHPFLKIGFPIGFLILIVGLLQEEWLLFGVPVHILGSFILIMMHGWNLLAPHHPPKPIATT